MRKIILSLLVGAALANADYIPYEKLSDMEFSGESGWRGDYKEDVFYLSIEKNEPMVSISKRLYNELLKHKDYKGHLHQTEWTSSSGAKSYTYELIIPYKSIVGLPHEQWMITYKIQHPNKYLKQCIGRATINDDGFIHCEADTLESMFRK